MHITFTIHHTSRAFSDDKNFLVNYFPIGLPFAVTATDQDPQKKKQMKKQKVDKNTCNKCNEKSGMTGHILCIKCRQWQHLKCVGLNLSEVKLKKANYKCEDCK